MPPNWINTWKQSDADPAQRLGLSLVLLNGITVEQVNHLSIAAFDLDRLWLHTDEYTVYPLAKQTAEAFVQWRMHDQSTLHLDGLAEQMAEWGITEAEAHRRLAGALWYTSEDGQIIREISGTSDSPVLPLRFTFPFSVIGRLGTALESDIARQSQKSLQTAADWLVHETLDPPPGIAQRIIGTLREGRTVFLLVSTGVNALNLLHNFLMGRLLTPADYSQLTLIITLQLLIGLFPTALQTVAARFSAGYAVHEQFGLIHALQRFLNTTALQVGLGTGALVFFGAPLLANIFQLNDAGLLVPMSIAWIFFIVLSVDRGLLQGFGQFSWLSGAYLSEACIRLGVGVLLGYSLLSAGHALDGATWAVAESVIVTWLITFLGIRLLKKTSDTRSAPSANLAIEQRAWIKIGGLTLVSLIGQALITNSDFLLVKTYFDPTTSGLYAAISVLGRIAYFGAMPITIILIPLIARRQALNQPTQQILWLLIGGGLALCGGLIIATLLFGNLIVSVLYGSAYSSATAYLASYTLAASLYVITNLCITYRVALGRGDEAWMPLLGGIAQVVGIILFHGSLDQVILVQIVLMAMLMGAVLWRILSDRPNEQTA